MARLTSITICFTLELRFAIGLIVLAAATRLLAGPPTVTPSVSQQTPRLYPDYAGITIPPNIAPLNFSIAEPGVQFYVSVRAGTGVPIEIYSVKPAIHFAERSWRQLLRLNTGSELLIDVWAEGPDRSWQRFHMVTNHIAREEIDPVLLYRKIHPTHNSWREMGIYQRDLGSFEETPVLENHHFNNDCCHCHSLRNNDPRNAIILIRSATYQNSLLIVSNGVPGVLQGLAGFSAWHPGMDIVASAFGKPRLLLHSAKPNDMRDIAELESWIGYFSLRDPQVKRVPAGPASYLLGSPAWAPDGSHLYYCSAPNPLTNSANSIYDSYSAVRYNLMRLSYDAAKDRWGEPELVLNATVLGFSAAQPRLSPDGRWLFFCRTAHGCWPTYDPGSDLYGIDLNEPRGVNGFSCRRLELNSDECESWLSWSSNSRWVVFSSKRVSPLLNRPHLAYVGIDGHCGKPFILPQREPDFYDSCLKTFTIPTLAKGLISVPEAKLLKSLKAKNKPALLLPETPSTEVPADLH